MLFSHIFVGKREQKIDNIKRRWGLRTAKQYSICYSAVPHPIGYCPIPSTYLPLRSNFYVCILICPGWKHFLFIKEAYYYNFSQRSVLNVLCTWFFILHQSLIFFSSPFHTMKSVLRTIFTFFLSANYSLLNYNIKSRLFLFIFTMFNFLLPIVSCYEVSFTNDS